MVTIESLRPITFCHSTSSINNIMKTLEMRGERALINMFSPRGVEQDKGEGCTDENCRKINFLGCQIRTICPVSLSPFWKI